MSRGTTLTVAIAVSLKETGSVASDCTLTVFVNIPSVSLVVVMTTCAEPFKAKSPIVHPLKGPVQPVTESTVNPMGIVSAIVTF